MSRDDILYREAEAKIEALAQRAQSVLREDRYDEAALELVQIAGSVGLRAEVAALAGLPAKATDEILARAVVGGGPAFFWDEDWPGLRHRLVAALASGIEACCREAE